MSIFLRLLPYVRRYPALALGTLCCAIVSTLMLVVFPAVTQQIVDDVVRDKHLDRLWPLILTGLAAFIAQDGLNALRILLNNTFEHKVIYDLRSDLYEHIQKLPLRWFDNRATGDIMTCLIEDVTSVERVLVDGIEQGVVAVVQILIVGGAMFFYSPLLALVALLPIPFLAAGAVIYTTTARRRYSRQRKAAAVLNSLLHDNISGIRQIKTYTSEEREHTRFNKASEALKIATLDVMRAWAIYSPSMNFLTSLGSLAITGVGAIMYLHGAFPIGTLFAFFWMVRLLYEPVGRLHQLNQLFQAGRAAGDRVYQIVDEPTEVEESTGRLARPFRGAVSYRNVSFSYSEDKSVLHDVSFEVQPGEMVALVGSTGAGKSTIINLLARFYEYSDGEISVDGTPIRNVSRSFLRENIAMVTQESFLFNGTTAENLRVGKHDATEAEMWEALAAANAADFIRRLPEGLHQAVGERGIKLSVGEKQRVSIARALLKNPPILILDEATASVDNATERLIQEALDRLMASRTSFVIAHRLSTVRHADQILVLERGRIIERGRHDELLARGGAYAKLSASMELPAALV